MVNNRPTMRALLLVDAIFVVVMAAPGCAWQKICGEQLVETVSVVCSDRGFYSHRVSKRDTELFQDEKAAKSFLGTHIGSRQRRRTGRIATECCERVCSYDIVESYCNPWPVVEDRKDPMLGPVAPGRVRQDKSADADRVYHQQQQGAAAEANKGQDGEGNAVMTQRGGPEASLMKTLEALESGQYGEGANAMREQPQEQPAPLENEGPGREEEIPLPVPVPTKKRRKPEGRRSRENSRGTGSRSEGRNRKRTGSREGGKSSRRRGKGPRTKKGRDGRDRNKRWEAIVTSHVPAKDIIDALRSAYMAARRNPHRNVMRSTLNTDEKRDNEILLTPGQQEFALGPHNEKRVSQVDDDATLAALYHLALRLAQAGKE